ncbi:MAG: malonyl-ACP O-methyltransferase BioC [Methylobacterium sp.]|nr:malonyl-ACP O-methyltransferase BioC [Methylobacterium sp.]
MPDEYTLDKLRVRAAFDRAAEGYDAAAVMQQEVRQRMLERLDYIRITPQRILDAGAGTGHAAAALAARFTGSRVVQLDLALRMLQVSRIRRPWWRRLFGDSQAYVGADIEHLPLADAGFDFYWSNLAIQWCNDPDQMFREAARVLKPGGLLMFSTLGPDTLKELRVASAADPGSVHVSRFIDMHDIGDALVRAGFSAPVMDVEHIVLTYEDVFGVMRDLKSIGAHNATQGRRRGLEGKRFLQQLSERYEQFRRDGRLPATFEVVYGHAWNGDQSGLPDGTQPIKIHRK